jgi:hypothetical protein
MVFAASLIASSDDGTITGPPQPDRGLSAGSWEVLPIESTDSGYSCPTRLFIVLIQRFSAAPWGILETASRLSGTSHCVVVSNSVMSFFSLASLRLAMNHVNAGQQKLAGFKNQRLWYDPGIMRRQPLPSSAESIAIHAVTVANGLIG